MTARLHKEGLRLAIILDGKCISAPGVKNAIRTGSGEISLGGGGSDNAELKKEQEGLLNNLNAGALKTPITVQSVRSTSATLGAESVAKGVRAIVIGLLTVLLFMAIYYWGAGLVANLALVLNLIILLGLLCVFQATFSLLGIASLILTIGMSIDANILVFERIREEVNTGKALKGALASGYKKAFSTIIDANITTVGTAAILLWFSGSGPIKSFAIVLIVGIIASMFTALFVTRTIFTILMRLNIFRKARMLQAFKKPNFQFGKIIRVTKFVSLAVIILGIAFFASRGSKNFGIDFLGGAQYRIGLTAEDATAADLREQLHELAPDFEAPEVLQMETPEESGLFAREFVIRVSFSGIQAIVERAGMADSLPQDQWVDYVKGKITENIEEKYPQGFPLDPIVPDTANTRYSEIILDVAYDNDKLDDEAIAKAKLGNALDIAEKEIANIVGEVLNITRDVDELGAEGSRTFRIALTGFHYPGAKEKQIKESITRNINDYFANYSPVLEFDEDHADDPNAIVRMIFNFQVPTMVGDAELESYKEGVLAELAKLSIATTDDLKPIWAVDVRGFETGEITDAAPKFETVGEFRYLSVPLDISARKDSKETYASLVRSTKMALTGPNFADKKTTQDYPISLSPGGMSAAEEFKPTVAEDLRVNAFYAIFLALVFIIVYIWFRFRKISFGIGAVVALIHDVLIALAAIAIFDSIPGIDVKFDMPIVAAILTIIGYSLNDTIVVFDRIRENMGLHRDERYYAENINNSINQTLSRTIWTSLTTFFVALSLAVLGGESLRGFAVILCVGVVVGTYSSIFIASPVVEWLHKREFKDKPAAFVGKRKGGESTAG